MKMSSLNLNAPLTVQSTVTIQETLNLLTKEGFDQVPVVDEEGWDLFSSLNYGLMV